MNQADEIETLNVNLWAGPGVGKSVTAASLFVRLKLAGITTEWVPEQAKTLHYRGTLLTTSQKSIVKAQARAQSLLQGKVEVVLSDSPVMLSLAYASAEEQPKLQRIVFNATRGWRMLNVLLHRDLTGAYEQSGRYQSEDEAKLFHRDTLAPFVRAHAGDTLQELEVSEAVDLLEQQIVDLVNRTRAARMKLAA